MQIPGTCKIDLACSRQKDSRFATEHAKLDGDYLVATDGRMLAKIPVQRAEDDEDGLISKEAIKIARQRQHQTPNGTTQIGANGNLIIGCNEGPQYPRPEGGEFPPYDNVIPSEEDGQFTICLNPRMLWDLAQAIGCQPSDGVRLTFQSPTDPVLLHSQVDGAVGVIMPRSSI